MTQPATDPGAPDAPAEGGAAEGLVVEDLPEVRAWLAATLAAVFPGMTVAQAGSLAEGRAWARRRAGARRPARAIALVDLGLPDGSGVELIEMLTRTQPDVLCVVSTIYDDDGHLFDALAAGAQGYLLKNEDAASLTRGLEKIGKGEPPLSPSVARRILDHFREARRPSAPEAASLTPRETDVLGLLGRGLRVNEAARLLGISEHTVADHVKTIYRKLNICSRAEAAVEAVRRGLV